MGPLLPPVGWIIIVTSKERLERRIEDTLVRWLITTGWNRHVKIVISLTENAEEEVIDLVAHTYQSNPSKSLPLLNDDALTEAICFTKRWLTQLVQKE